MHAPPKTHFIIANGEHARCVERSERGFVTLHEITAGHHHHPAGAKRVVHQSATPQRHGADEEDVAARRREDFGRELAGHLNAEVAAGRYDRLAIVAPARMLREIRSHLSKAAQVNVVAQLDKDLTKVANHELDRWLRHPDLA